MSDQIWVNNRQPQTLYIAQVIMRFRGVMAILLGGALFSLGSVSLFGSTLLGAVYTPFITVGVIAGVLGIANERAWGYKLGVAAAAAPLKLVVVLFIAGLEALTFDTVGLLFDIALIALLLHPMSRDYQRLVPMSPPPPFSTRASTSTRTICRAARRNAIRCGRCSTRSPPLRPGEPHHVVRPRRALAQGLDEKLAAPGGSVVMISPAERETSSRDREGRNGACRT